MKRALLFGALWLAATAATGAVAWGAVRLAGEQTAEQAVRPMTARQVEALAASSTTGASAVSTTTAASSTTVPASTTTAASGPTSTLASPVIAARQTRGGTVVVSLEGDSLSLVSATPAPGYSVEVEENGPGAVVVVFEGGEDDEVRVRAVASGGEVRFEVEMGGEDE